MQSSNQQKISSKIEFTQKYIDKASSEIKYSFNKVINTAESVFRQTVRNIDSFNYKNILSKGYVILQNHKSEVIDSVNKLKDKMIVQARFQDGDAHFIIKLSKQQVGGLFALLAILVYFFIK